MPEYRWVYVLKQDNAIYQSIMSFIYDKISRNNSWNVISSLKKFGEKIFSDIYKEHREEFASTVLGPDADELDEQEKEIWIRHVVVPGITLVPEYLERLGTFLAHFKHIKALDVLPYHDMGKVKYENMGIDYVLKDVEPATKQQAIEARETIIEAMKKERHKMESEQ